MKAAPADSRRRLIFGAGAAHAGARSPLLPGPEAEPMNWNAFITCAVTGAGDTVDKHPAVSGDPARDRRFRDRSGAGGGGRRAPPRARPRDGTRGTRSGPVSGGGGAHPRFRRRRGHQPHRRDGRRPGARRGRASASSGSGRDRHGGSPRAARPRGRAAARNLHPGLRHHELRRGRLRHDQHPVHAARDGEAGEGTRGTAGAGGWRSSIPAIWYS